VFIEHLGAIQSNKSFCPTWGLVLGKVGYFWQSASRTSLRTERIFVNPCFLAHMLLRWIGSIEYNNSQSKFNQLAVHMTLFIAKKSNF
jgi:hypothetical protein